MNIGIVLYSAAVLFTLVTLPVELNASRRAMTELSNRNILVGDELTGAKKVLSAAALTYVAAALMAILQLVRLILISRRSSSQRGTALTQGGPMSIPRLLLVPTHRTGLANAVAAALAEIVTAHGRKVRYHHLGPLGPAACWDRWEGTAFLDPDLYDEDSLLRLYDVATRSAQLSLLSASQGVLDRRRGLPVAAGRCRPAARLPGGARPRLPRAGAPGSGLWSPA